MARATIAIQQPIGTYPTLPVTATSADLVETAADVANKEQTTIGQNRFYLLAHNTDASSHTVTITSIADGRGRVGDITSYAVAAGKIAVFGPFQNEGWQQATGYLYYEANHAGVLFSVLAV